MKKVLALVVAMAMLMAAVPGFAADPVYMGISVVIDGEKLVPTDVNGNSTEPFAIDGTTYLPIRAVAAALGLDVDWDGETRTVVIGKAGSPVLGDQINITIDGAAFTAKDVNGTVVYPVAIEGSVYIPVRGVAEAFDKKVDWDGETKTVVITTPAQSNELGNKYYVITNVGTGKALATVDLAKDNSSALTTLDATDAEDFAWRLGKMGDGVYNISNAVSGRSIDVPSASTDAGKALIIYDSNGNGNQQWAFEETAEGVYMLKVSHSGLYMDASGETVVQAEKNDSDYQKWTLKYVKDSTLGSVVNSEGFKLLDSAVQEGFKNYMFGGLPACYSVANSAESYLIANDFENASPKLQAEMIKTVMSYTAYGQVTGNMLETEPAPYKIVKEYEDDNYDIWRGSREKCWLYDVEMDGDEPGTIHKFTVVSNEENSAMVEKMIDAIGVFPYAVRQYVHCLIWKKGDDANNYNGGGDTIWARLNWEPNTTQIAQTYAHELGHILDSNQLEDMMIWSAAEALDAVPISSYGSSSQAEDLAEFHRLYWTTRGRETADAVEKVYPNRIRVFRGLLYRADKEHFAEFKDDEQFILDLKAKIDAYGDKETAGKLDMGQYYKIEDAESGLCWTIENASMDNTAKVVLAEYTGADNQKFSVETVAGLVRFTNKNSNLPIQLNTSAMENKPLTQYGGEWSLDERLQLKETEGGFEMWSRRYGLAVTAVTEGVGDDFVPYAAQGHTPGVWKIEAVEKAPDVEYKTISVGGKYLVADDGLQFTEPSEELKDQWLLMPVGDAYTIVYLQTGKAVDISGGNTEPGAKLIAWDLSKNDNQLFYMEPAGGENQYLLKMKHSGLYLTLNADNTITQENRDAAKNQVFVIE